MLGGSSLQRCSPPGALALVLVVGAGRFTLASLTDGFVPKCFLWRSAKRPSLALGAFCSVSAAWPGFGGSPGILLALSVCPKTSPRRLVAMGRTNKDVGDLLGMSPRTAQAHIRNVYDKGFPADSINVVSRMIDPTTGKPS
jgi:hypothetical protein